MHGTSRDYIRLPLHTTEYGIRRQAMYVLACPTLQCLSTLSHIWHFRKKKKLLNKNVCFNFLYKFVWNISHSKRKRVKYDKNVCWSSRKNLNFLDRFSKNIQIPNFTKIRPVGAELFHMDGRAHMTKLTAAFHNFANAPKSWAYTCTELHTRGLSSCVPKWTGALIHFIKTKILEWTNAADTFNES